MRDMLEGYSTAFRPVFDASARPGEAEIHVGIDGMGTGLSTRSCGWKVSLFLNRYPKAFVFGINHCPGCHVCSAEEGIGACKKP